VSNGIGVWPPGDHIKTRPADSQARKLTVALYRGPFDALV
jgi:hypothetical protein